MKEKKEKSQKLEQKVNLLIEKIEKEESPIKRLGYVIRCKMLVSKLERQINLQTAKENFEKQKEENGITAKEEKVSARSKIIELNKRIKEIEAEIRKNSEYDYLSSKFIFPDKEVEREGGIKKYIEELKNSGIPEQEETARKIEENIERRKELKVLKVQLAEQQEQLNNVDEILKKQNNKASRDKTALVLKSKFNIFDGIRNFATSVTSSVKEFFAELKDNKSVDKEKSEKLSDLQEAYEKRQAEIRQEYEARMQKLDKKRAEIEGRVKEEYKDTIDSKKQSRRSEQAVEFKERLQNIKGQGTEHEEDGKDNDRNQEEVASEERNDDEEMTQ